MTKSGRIEADRTLAKASVKALAVASMGLTFAGYSSRGRWRGTDAPSPGAYSPCGANFTLMELMQYR